MMHAYDEDYLYYAQKILGDAFDFAINTVKISPQEFEDRFTGCAVSKEFAAGNVRYIVGMNGCELAEEVLRSTGYTDPLPDHVMYTDKSPEFWSGWILAFYQWYRGFSFKMILSSLNFKDILFMYPTFHEMDVMHFVEAADEKLKSDHGETRLAFFRKNRGYSQSELAKKSGISIRQIQLFEQRNRDINKTSATTLFRLSRALGCDMSDLMEPDFSSA